jgi:hypothetical protein
MIRFLALAWMLSALLAHGQTRWVLIGGGGAAPEDAQRWLGEVSENFELTKLFSFSSGFPAVSKSDDYPGLKPGLHVVVLAVCSDKDKEGLLSLFQVVDAGIYARPLTASPPMACPQEATPIATVGNIRAYAFKLPYTGFPVDRVRVLLVDEAGKTLDSWTPTTAIDLGTQTALNEQKADPYTGCSHQFKELAGKLVIEEECEEFAGGAAHSSSQSASYEVSFKGRRLVVKRTARSKIKTRSWE